MAARRGSPTPFPGDPIEWRSRAGIHSHVTVPTDPLQRLFYAAMEAIGWECHKYGDAPRKPTRAVLEKWLTENVDLIEADTCPDYLTLMAGGFDFMRKGASDAS